MNSRGQLAPLPIDKEQVVNFSHLRDIQDPKGKPTPLHNIESATARPCDPRQVFAYSKACQGRDDLAKTLDSSGCKVVGTAKVQGGRTQISATVNSADLAKVRHSIVDAGGRIVPETMNRDTGKTSVTFDVKSVQPPSRAHEGHRGVVMTERAGRWYEVVDGKGRPIDSSNNGDKERVVQGIRDPSTGNVTYFDKATTMNTRAVDRGSAGRYANDLKAEDSLAKVMPGARIEGSDVKVEIGVDGRKRATMEIDRAQRDTVFSALSDAGRSPSSPDLSSATRGLGKSEPAIGRAKVPSSDMGL